MKKSLLFIIAAMMASVAMADCYMYVDTIEIQAEQHGTEIVVPLKAHFDARVEDWYVSISMDNPLTYLGAEPGQDFEIPYVDQNGNQQVHSPRLMMGDSYPYFETDNWQAGYWDPDQDGTYESYGVVKWEPGDYDEMILMRFLVPDNYGGGEVYLYTEVYATTDARGGTVLETGENGQGYSTTSRFSIPVTPNPVVTFEEVADTLIVTFTGEGILTVDWSEVSNPYSYKITREYYDQTIEHWVWAQAPGKEPSEEIYVNYLFKSKIPPKTDPPLIYWDYTDTTMQIKVQGLGGGYLFVNGDPVSSPFTIPRFEQDSVITVSAYAQWGYYLSSDTVVMQVTVPGLNAEITPTPKLYIHQANEAYTFEVVGEGEHFFYLNGVRVEEPYVYERPNHGEGDVVLELAWAAQIPGMIMSKMSYTWQWVSEKPKFYDFVEDSVYYLITDEGKVSVVWRDNYTYTYKGELVIPDYVTHDGVTYMVTAIGYGACAGCTELTSVKIGSNVTTIEEDAFIGCSGLTEVTLGNYVINIGTRAFYNTGLQRVTLGCGVANIGLEAFRFCRSLNTIICKAATPPALYDSGVFSDYNKPTLYVHPAVEESYRASELWGLFTNIEAQKWVDPEPGDITGNGTVDVDDVTNLINRVLYGK